MNVVEEAQSLLWKISVFESDFPVRKRNNALSIHFNDIITLVRCLDSSDTFVPVFVIKQPSEVPCLLSMAYTSLVFT